MLLLYLPSCCKKIKRFFRFFRFSKNSAYFEESLSCKNRIKNRYSLMQKKKIQHKVKHKSNMFDSELYTILFVNPFIFDSSQLKHLSFDHSCCPL